MKSVLLGLIVSANFMGVQALACTQDQAEAKVLKHIQSSGETANIRILSKDDGAQVTVFSTFDSSEEFSVFHVIAYATLKGEDCKEMQFDAMGSMKIRYKD